MKIYRCTFSIEVKKAWRPFSTRKHPVKLRALSDCNLGIG